jgi:hypothetical protein
MCKGEKEVNKTTQEEIIHRIPLQIDSYKKGRKKHNPATSQNAVFTAYGPGQSTSKEKDSKKNPTPRHAMP